MWDPRHPETQGDSLKCAFRFLSGRWAGITSLRLRPADRSARAQALPPPPSPWPCDSVSSWGRWVGSQREEVLGAGALDTAPWTRHHEPGVPALAVASDLGCTHHHPPLPHGRGGEGGCRDGAVRAPRATTSPLFSVSFLPLCPEHTPGSHTLELHAEASCVCDRTVPSQAQRTCVPGARLLGSEHTTSPASSRGQALAAAAGFGRHGRHRACAGVCTPACLSWGLRVPGHMSHSLPHLHASLCFCPPLTTLGAARDAGTGQEGCALGGDDTEGRDGKGGRGGQDRETWASWLLWSSSHRRPQAELPQPVQVLAWTFVLGSRGGHLGSRAAGHADVREGGQ